MRQGCRHQHPSTRAGAGLRAGEPAGDAVLAKSAGWTLLAAIHPAVPLFVAPRDKNSHKLTAQVNEGNIRTLTKELLDYLNVCDPEFKPDLTAKICQLVQRYAPDK